MITADKLQELDDVWRGHALGARPIEAAQAELLWAILCELRTMREMQMDSTKRMGEFADQFDRVSAGGNSLTVETA